MENASKALLIAASVLVGVLLISLMTTLFVSGTSLSRSYEKTKTEESIQQFNANFIKYLNQDLTIHQVVTICNFAGKNGVTVVNGSDIECYYNEYNIKEDVNKYGVSGNTVTNVEYYELKIISYSDEGYINKIKIISS